MDVFYRIKYFTTKGLLTVFGPAQLDSDGDPMERLERQRDRKLGPKTQKPAKPHVHKRHFAQGAEKGKAKAAAK